MDGEEDAKYAFARTGGWWRARFAHAGKASPLAHATPLFAAGGGAGGTGGTLNVAVHVRRGDMVCRSLVEPRGHPDPDPHPHPDPHRTLTLTRTRTRCTATSSSSSCPTPTTPT